MAKQIDRSARPDLTEKQRAIYTYIESLITERGASPTLREIGERFGITSTNGVRTHLTALVRKGYLNKQDFLARGLELARPLIGKISRVPIVGSVPAGRPIDAIENIDGELAVDSLLAPRGESFSLRVIGDSMHNAGIFDGDFVVVKKQSVAESGDIIVALINGEATVKRYFVEGKQVRLQPENDAFQPIIVNRRSGEFRIAGKVVGLVRRLG